MCGIYGSTRLYSDDIVKQKLNYMKFRGPNHQEFQKIKKLNDEQIILGHVRLAILDLDKRSNQPFKYNENIVIVFNGEIYNYQELKHTYLGDVDFSTESDTEVICAMYEKFGKDCVKFFNGMFAFVIFDKQKNILVGARDRLGKKPFYYNLTAASFEFASQLNSIRFDNNFTISQQSRKFYLLNGYIPDPYCICEEVSKLRAGQLFTLTLETYEMKIEQYWDIFSNSYGFEKPKCYSEAKEQLKDLLFDSVKIRLNADVPIGMFLSGGIDSSLSSAIISRLTNKIEAYTIGFNDPKYNESTYANDIANYLGIPIHIKYCEGKDMLDSFDNYCAFYDEPFADHSLIPTSYLVEQARKNVTVAIGGDGGDELFFGYYRYFGLKKKKQFYNIPYSIRKNIYNIIKNIYNNHNINLLRYKTLEEAYLARGDYGFLFDTELFDIFELVKKLPDYHYLFNERGLLKYADYDIKHYLNNCINTKTDRASMRYSLELRSPLMDYRVAEYSRLLPYEYLYDNKLGGKKILKDILYEMVPRQLLDRPKTGFCAPVGNWFKNELKDLFIDRVSMDNLMIFIPELNSLKIIKLRDEFLKGINDSETTFFKIFSYIEWCLHYNIK